MINLENDAEYIANRLELEENDIFEASLNESYAKLPKAPLPLPPDVADYAARLSKAYWLFLERHVEAYESGKPNIAATCIVKESEGALQALADVFGLPALKAALEVRGELCPIVVQQTSERLIAKY